MYDSYMFEHSFVACHESFNALTQQRKQQLVHHLIYNTAIEPYPINTTRTT
jgi:hypothetical protein